MTENTSNPAALARAKVVTKGAAFPKLNTAMMMLKKTSRILPTVYSGSVCPALTSVSVQPYQKPSAYAPLMTGV